MHFRAEHRFASSPTSVLEAMVDAELYLNLELPDLSRPDVVEDARDGSRAHLQLRYTFEGQLDPIARHLLGGSTLRWLQDVTVDATTNSGRLSFAAEDQPNRLHGAAAITFDAAKTTIRVIDGELVVDVPFISGIAERAIVPGIVTRLDLEADAIRRRLAAI